MSNFTQDSVKPAQAQIHLDFTEFSRDPHASHLISQLLHGHAHAPSRTYLACWEEGKSNEKRVHSDKWVLAVTEAARDQENSVHLGLRCLKSARSSQPSLSPGRASLPTQQTRKMLSRVQFCFPRTLAPAGLLIPAVDHSSIWPT